MGFDELGWGGDAIGGGVQGNQGRRRGLCWRDYPGFLSTAPLPAWRTAFAVKPIVEGRKMKTRYAFSSMLGAWLLVGPATAAALQQPPMNDFYSAYYTCEDGGAFSISYNAARPTQATITTSNNNARYALKRSQVADGVQFSNDKVKFWTDGKTVVVEGTAMPYRECKIKTG